jgi:hypothetical protein
VAWVQDVPVTVWVTGATPAERTWVQLDFEITTTGPVTVGQATGIVNTYRRVGSHLSVCLTVPGTGPLRRAAVPLGFSPIPQLPGREEYAIPGPPEGVQLASLRALDRPCDLQSLGT